jgi:pimeloyl-ACP methyl ester carboxylesterase
VIREQSSQAIDLPGGRFHLLRAGPAGGPPVVVLHGFPDHPPTFDAVIEALAEAGHQVIAPWLRGYAPSTLAGPYHVDRLATDVLELATALGHQRFAVLGHDWGAVITYLLCASAPARISAAVTMAVPHPLALRRAPPAQLRRSWYMGFFQLPGAAAIAAARDFALIDRLWRRWSPGLVLDDARRRALHACLAASMPAPIEYYRAILRPLGEAVARIRRTPLARPIEVPLLHLQGADDGCIGAELGRGQERWFRGPFDSEVVPDAGHFLQVEVPELVAAEALAWYAAHL